MDFSWQSFADPEPDSELVGVLGQLRPLRYRTVPRVMLKTRRIESQLAESDGLVGYALRAKPLQRRFWAVAVWEDEASLRSFVEADPHAGIRAALRDAMEEGRFQTFDVDGAEVPLDMDEAIARVG